MISHGNVLAALNTDIGADLNSRKEMQFVKKSSFHYKSCIELSSVAAVNVSVSSTLEEVYKAYISTITI
jgi:hypothetical protein